MPPSAVASVRFAMKDGTHDGKFSTIWGDDYEDSHAAPLKIVLGWFPCVQVTSHLPKIHSVGFRFVLPYRRANETDLTCIRLLSVRSSLHCINTCVRIELTQSLSIKFIRVDSIAPNEAVRVENAVSKLYFLQIICIGIGTFLNEHFQLV